VDRGRWGSYITVALLLAGGILIAYLCFRVFQPFLGPIVWATVLAVLLHPWYERAAQVVRSRSAAAVLVCILATLILGVPLFYLISSLPGEIKEAYAKVNAALHPSENGGGGDPRVGNAWHRMADLAARAGYDLPSVLSDRLKRAAAQLLALTPRIIGEAVEYVANFVLTLLALFFFLRDGERLTHWLRGLVPLDEGQTQELFSKIRDVIRATVAGGLAVALAQGLIGGILFLALGIPAALLWGVLMGTLSLVPPLGAWIIWIPAGAILLWQGSIAKGLVLLAGGAVAISTVDNILRPLIIGQRTQLPTLLIFFSLLGGIQFFGPVGLIVGPVLVALLIGILEFTRERVQRQTKADAC